MLKFIRWLFAPRYRFVKLLIAFLLLVIVILLFNQFIDLINDFSDPRTQNFLEWSQGGRDDLVTVQREACPGAPFILPSDGFIGLLYGDPRGPYSQAQPHQGIDIFSNSDPGQTPVYAAYDGYVYREPDWASTLIIRVPQDPLQPERQIWLYYTHMADREGNDFILDAFPPGTREKFVEQGTLLGYTGDYNGQSLRSIWVHLHFSIVMDNGSNQYLNELEFTNTVDPSPYLGMNVNHNCDPGASGCGEVSTCFATN